MMVRLEVSIATSAPRSKGKSINFEWTDICRYPGIYELNSEEERLLNNHRRSQDDESHRSFLKYSGPLVEHGLIKKDFHQRWKSHLSIRAMENDRISLHHDIQTMLKIDERLRWCRCLLDTVGLPYDREAVLYFEEPSTRRWVYQSEATSEELANTPTVDPIDHLMPRLTPFSPEWYATKVLSHNRRAEMLAEKAVEKLDFRHEIGLAREWMLFGETWAEAKFIINHSGTAISGSKQRRGAVAGSNTRRNQISGKTKKVLGEMKRLMEEPSNRSVSDAARIAFRNGFGASAEANRKLWYRDHKKLGQDTPMSQS